MKKFLFAITLLILLSGCGPKKDSDILKDDMGATEYFKLKSNECGTLYLVKDKNDVIWIVDVGMTSINEKYKVGTKFVKSEKDF